MYHRARCFVLVTFLKNPEKKNKDYNKRCLPFQPFFFCFLFVYALCISLGGDIAIIDSALTKGRRK